MKSKAFLLAVLLSVSVLASAAPPTLRFCTGGEGGFYEKLGATIGSAITKQTGGELKVINTRSEEHTSELQSQP